MLIIGIQTKEIDEDTVNKLKKDLIEWFTNGDGSEARVTSLFIKVIQKRYAISFIRTIYEGHHTCVNTFES